jgi:SAM-dependent methyltransferase
MRLPRVDDQYTSVWLDDDHLLGAYVQHRILVDLLNKHLPDGATEDCLLDVGTGKGTYLPLYLRRCKRVYAVDIPWSPHQAKVDCWANVLALPFKSGSFDVVACTEVLEHVENPRQALSEMRRVLKRGGKLLLSVPFMQAEHEQPHDYFRYTRYGLQMLCRQTGFGTCYITPIGELISTAFLFGFKPLYKLCSLIARRLGIPVLASRWNPLLFITVLVPGWLGVHMYRLAQRNATLGRFWAKLSYQPLGYFVVAEP